MLILNLNNVLSNNLTPCERNAKKVIHKKTKKNDKNTAGLKTSGVIPFKINMVGVEKTKHIKIK
jgi:hypothetical protein